MSAVSPIKVGYFGTLPVYLLVFLAGHQFYLFNPYGILLRGFKTAFNV